VSAGCCVHLESSREGLQEPQHRHVDQHQCRHPPEARQALPLQTGAAEGRGWVRVRVRARKALPLQTGEAEGREWDDTKNVESVGFKLTACNSDAFVRFDFSVQIMTKARYL
jgi:hypothetical protein